MRISDWSSDVCSSDLIDRAEAKSDKPRPGVVAGVAGGRKRAENLWKYLQGENNVPVLAEGWLERPSYYALRGIAGTRDVLTSALLGSSPISAISDFNTQVDRKSTRLNSSH